MIGPAEMWDVPQIVEEAGVKRHRGEFWLTNLGSANIHPHQLTRRQLLSFYGSGFPVSNIVQNMDISYMYHPIYIRHFGSREKECTSSVFKDHVF